MADAYPYAAQRANARRWINQMRAIAYLGEAWLLARQQPRLPAKRPRLRSVPREINYEVPALCRRQAD